MLLLPAGALFPRNYITETHTLYIIYYCNRVDYRILQAFLTRAYFQGRAYIAALLENNARSYFQGRSYFWGNGVGKFSLYGAQRTCE